MQTSNFKFTSLHQDREGLEGILQWTSIERRRLCALWSGSRWCRWIHYSLCQQMFVWRVTMMFKQLDVMLWMLRFFFKSDICVFWWMRSYFKYMYSLWYLNEVSFCNSISVFLHSTFCTCTTETAFQEYFYMKSSLDTIQRPYKWFHHHESWPNISNKWLELKIEIKTNFSSTKMKCPFLIA